MRILGGGTGALAGGTKSGLFWVQCPDYDPLPEPLVSVSKNPAHPFLRPFLRPARKLNLGVIRYGILADASSSLRRVCYALVWRRLKNGRERILVLPGMDYGKWAQRGRGNAFGFDHITLDIDTAERTLHVSTPRDEFGRKARVAPSIALPEDRHGYVNVAAFFVGASSELAPAGIAMMPAVDNLKPGGRITENDLDAALSGIHPVHVLAPNWGAQRHLELNFLLANGPPDPKRVPGVLHAPPESRDEESRHGVFPIVLTGLQMGDVWLHVGVGLAPGRLRDKAGLVVGQPAPEWRTGLPERGLDAATRLWAEQTGS